MRKTLALLALAFAMCSCSTLAQVERLTSDGETAPSTDQRIPGGWFLSPAEPADRLCSGMVSATELPCREVLNVCGDDGTLVWLPVTSRCTEASPRWRDVCATRPAVEWAFYALTPERCTELLG